MEKVKFRVDSGLINRLGIELVGRAETAISELIKNAYDADATSVDVLFKETNQPNGTITIDDNGTGMDLHSFNRGFMTISSTDKLEFPKSPRYQRSRAGRKGIGRFSTQRLGKVLTIITQTLQSDLAIKATINWDDYEVNQSLDSISHDIEFITKTKEEGTTLIISEARDIWTEKSIARVYRTVAELFQPEYLSEQGKVSGFTVQGSNSFKVNFSLESFGIHETVANPEKLLFSKSVAVIEGFIDKLGDGYFGVKSEHLGLEDYAIEVRSNSLNGKFIARDLYFKAYYFIYNRIEYYSNISKLELKTIQNQSKDLGGVRLYRNGFRVLPYGEPKDDWLGLDSRYSGEEGSTNIPFANRNLFGYVEIIDPQGVHFEETSSREGLIENDYFLDLKDYLFKALISARLRIAEKITIIRQKRKDEASNKKQLNIFESINEISRLAASSNVDEKSKLEIEKLTNNVSEQIESQMQELGMYRVLASLGLTIAEFTHEITQYTPSIQGSINALLNKVNDSYIREDILSLANLIDSFFSYTSYFNSTISQNTSRELKPQVVADLVQKFMNTMRNDGDNSNISIDLKNKLFDQRTIPMHASEWNSILFNLYTNSKKAIKKANDSGKILISLMQDDQNVILEFSDNGIGIPLENRHRVFNAFFTTSTPAGFDSHNDDKLTGNGLGLTIVQEIIRNYNGSIELVEPHFGFSTTFLIKIPKFNG